jgi:hypothetical protein
MPVPGEGSDPLNDLPGGPNPPPSPEARGNVICEFCECRLTRSKGEIIEVSPKAKEFRRHAETREQLEGTIATLRQEKETLEARVRELSPAPASGGSRSKPFGSR